MPQCLCVDILDTTVANVKIAPLDRLARDA